MAIAYKDKIIDARTDRILLPETVASQVKMDENNEENLLDIITKLREENDQLNKDLSKSIEELRSEINMSLSTMTCRPLNYNEQHFIMEQGVWASRDETYTVPSEGVVEISVSSNGTWTSAFINNNTKPTICVYSGCISRGISVSKGDIFRFNSSSVIGYINFIPYKE